MPTTPIAPTSQFAPTRWSIVLAAGDWRAHADSRQAMDQLARTYWFPLYAFTRRRGLAPAAAEDLVQSFFTRLLEKDTLLAADPARGKFRSFLLVSLKNFLTNEWDKTQAQKRGARQMAASLNTGEAESRYSADPADDITPERLFEKRWAWAVLDRVLDRLSASYVSKGQGALFTALKGSLTSAGKSNHHALAQILGLTEGAVGVAVHRLRRRYRDLLRDEIAQTVASPELVDEEIRYLLDRL